MPDHNLYAALRAAFPADLDATAIDVVTGEARSYTWRDLDRGSARIANLLLSLGIPAASRIAAQTEKSVAGLMAYLGVLRAGHVWVPLNTAYQQEEIAYFIRDAEPAVFICTDEKLTWIAPPAAHTGTRHVFTLDAAGRGTLAERAAAMRAEQEVVPKAAADVACIIYTSGTTGRSKGAMLTHGNLLANARPLIASWRWSPHDVLAHALPVFHVHGLFVALHSALLVGCRMLWYPYFDAAAVISRLPEATVFMGVPTMYVRMLAEPALSREACSQIRLFISGSAPLLPDTAREFQARTGHAIVERYGMSETVILTSNPCDGERRIGTVGRPLPGVGVRVCDERGQMCPAGSVGHVEVNGPGVFAGYWRMPERTREEFTVDGWFRTGDVGVFDGDGYLTLVGRSKDLIISGGYNVYPAEVESVINEHPAVAESAVVGVPHPDFGEGVIAVLVLRPGADLAPTDLVGALRNRIAAYKVPKRAYIVRELPRNAMGKVQKATLREQYSAAFSG